MPKQPRDITSGFYLSYQTSSQHSKVEMQKTKKPYCLPGSMAIMHSWETMLMHIEPSHIFTRYLPCTVQCVWYHAEPLNADFQK